jgi:hypothetical protein
MDHRLKHIQRVCPAAFWPREFFLLHDNVLAHKAATVCQFLTKICYNPLQPPVLSRFISTRLFSVPQVENKLKGLHFVDVAEIQEAVTNEWKKVQKEEVLAALSSLYDHAKACKYANGAYFE